MAKEMSIAAKIRIVFIFAICTNIITGITIYQVNQVWAFIGCVVVNAIIILVAAEVIAFDMKRGVDQLKEATKQLAVGNLHIDTGKRHNDEFGRLMDDILELASNLQHDADLATEIANGNLTIDVVPKSPADALGNAFKKLVKDNNEVLNAIKSSSLEVNTGAEQVASASQSLAQGSTEQASALEQVTVSIDDIALKTKENAAQANQANQLVHATRNGAKSGNERMIDMKAAMEDINESSEGISKIIKVIDDIAFQTNILALNAAVEAARAGSYGKGFAVVAEEVRNLASKSSSAASETAAMIEDSIHKVQIGSKLADETAKALEEIVAQVEKIVEIISNIAEASSNQATAIQQVDQAVSQVSQVVQTNSATSEECAAASEELSSQAHSLLSAIKKYKLVNSVYDSYPNDYDNYQDNYDDVQTREYGRPEEGEKIITLGTDFGKY